MTRRLALVFAAAAVMAGGWPVGAQSSDQALDGLLGSAAAYVRSYEERFSVLVAEERYVQEIRRPDNNPVAGNLTRNNPGGGFASNGGVRKRAVLRSDFLLVRLGEGAGWMPFRDTFNVNGDRVIDRSDRLAKLFTEPSDASFDAAARIMADSTRYNLGSTTRTVNIPTLALMFLHPTVRERFTFTRDGEETLDGRLAWRVEYHETARPALIKTTRGRDLPASGRLWIEAATGVVLKTTMTAADPLVRALITTTYRRDATLDLWVPARMEDYYKADSEVDEVTGIATYSNYRTFTVATDLALRKPQPQ
ncbi:MAG: hypothetical protein IT181_10380 [Acidobacteria bacterium]|nr:hypothetical protein [Acidobacteriota bacterium]